jgi:hypothetical protein
MEDLIPVTTFVPQSRVLDFQRRAAAWVADPDPHLEGDTQPARFNDRWEADRRPDWTTDETELAEFLHKKLWNRSVSGRALTFMTHHPDEPFTGGALAVELGLVTDPHEIKGFRQIAGCWGHLGRYCEERKRPIPFQFSDDKGYWITAATAEVLKKAGF